MERKTVGIAGDQHMREQARSWEPSPRPDAIGLQPPWCVRSRASRLRARMVHRDSRPDGKVGIVPAQYSIGTERLHGIDGCGAPGGDEGGDQAGDRRNNGNQHQHNRITRPGTVQHAFEHRARQQRREQSDSNSDRNQHPGPRA